MEVRQKQEEERQLKEEQKLQEENNGAEAKKQEEVKIEEKKQPAEKKVEPKTQQTETKITEKTQRAEQKVEQKTVPLITVQEAQGKEPVSSEKASPEPHRDMMSPTLGQMDEETFKRRNAEIQVQFVPLVFNRHRDRGNSSAWKL